MMRQKMTICILLAAASGLLLLPLAACKPDTAAGKEAGRPDLILIDGLARFGPLESTPVPFLHDMHMEIVQKDNRDCTACHLETAKGVLSQTYMRLEDTDRQTVMDVYHENCLACHKETARSGKPSGPVTCGECHVKKSALFSTRQPVVMDLSLHARHIDAADGKCDACHHQYDKTQKKLVSAPGQEVSCRDCHGTVPVENRATFRFVSHESCIDCHAEYGAGPRDCGGCHDPEKQKAIQKLETVPRLERGQPNQVYLTASKQGLGASRMPSVPFDHATHEAAAPTCRTCHHQTLRACRECHPLTEQAEKSVVRLERAMHAVQSPHSCVGCHETAKFGPNCAGCHGLMEKGALTPFACTRCHAGPPPAEAASQMPPAPPPPAHFEPSTLEAPERVEIAGLSKKFERVLFPHRRHAEKLEALIASSKLAVRFHGRQDLLCQGCHHHTPAGQAPPRCQSCHGHPFNELNLFMPGILGAYHRQCVGCHEQMGITTVSSCTSCHDPKGGTTSVP